MILWDLLLSQFLIQPTTHSSSLHFQSLPISMLWEAVWKDCWRQGKQYPLFSPLPSRKLFHHRRQPGWSRHHWHLVYPWWPFLITFLSSMCPPEWGIYYLSMDLSKADWSVVPRSSFLPFLLMLCESCSQTTPALSCGTHHRLES